MIKISHRGNFKKSIVFLNKALKSATIIENILNKYGKLGVQYLADATPVDTGKTAASWTYEVEISDSGYVITWNNTNINHYVNIALILQTGHGTRNGGYVRGRDYINPAIQPVFDQIAKEAWREVTS